MENIQVSVETRVSGFCLDKNYPVSKSDKSFLAALGEQIRSAQVGPFFPWLLSLVDNQGLLVSVRAKVVQVKCER